MEEDINKHQATNVLHNLGTDSIQEGEYVL